MSKTILVTGFISNHVAQALLVRGDTCVTCPEYLDKGTTRFWQWYQQAVLQIRIE